MRAAGWLLLGVGLGLVAGYLATQAWDSPAVVWSGVGVLVPASVLLGLSRGPARPQPPD